MDYTITINQIRTLQFDVEADTKEEAKEKAMQMAYDFDWGSVEHIYAGSCDGEEFEELEIGA